VRDRFIMPLLGRGLLTNEGESWQRQIMQPAFHRQRLALLATT
jgi:cytochrome P450